MSETTTGASRAETHARLREAIVAMAHTLEPQVRQELLDQLTVVCLGLAGGAARQGYLARSEAYREIARAAIALAPIEVSSHTVARLYAAIGMVDQPQADLTVRRLLCAE